MTKKRQYINWFVRSNILFCEPQILDLHFSFLTKKMTELKAPELTNKAIHSALNEIVEKYLKSNKFEMSINSASKSGVNNFVGIVYRVTFSKSDDAKTGKNCVHTLILKVAPQQLLRRKKFNVRPSFLREIHVYEKVRALQKFYPLKMIFIEWNAFIYRCYHIFDVLNCLKVCRWMVLMNIQCVIERSMMMLTNV